MNRSISVLAGLMLSVFPSDHAIPQEPTVSLGEVRAAQENWVKGFSGIRVRWRRWCEGDLHKTDPNLPPNTLLKDSPRYTLEEFCWSDLGKLSVSQSGVIDNTPRSLHMHGTNGKQAWESDAEHGHIEKWTLLKLMRIDTVHPVKTGVSLVATNGLWDVSPGRWFPDRLKTDPATTIELQPNQQINGIDCVVVQTDSLDAESRTTIREVACFDPSLQFLPRKLDRTKTTPDVTYVTRWMADEFELIDGLPFPKHGFYFMTGLTEPGFEWYVELVEFNPDFSASQFEPRMSAGTRIINYDQGYVGATAEDGKTILGANPGENATGTEVPSSDPQRDPVSVKTGIAEPGKSYWWLITVVCGVAVALGLTMKYVRRSPN